MFTPELRKRLSEIARGKSEPRNAHPEVEPPPGYACSFEFRGVEENTEHGPFMIAQCRMSEIVGETATIVCGVREAACSLKHDPTQLLFLDLETCGLSSVPVFLVGTMLMEGDDFIIRQFFARDYSEEKSLLCRVGESVTEANGVVTFNGKSFDVPFLRDRMVRYRLDFAQPGAHLDLLPWARRKWRWSLPDCRLQTLESFVCRRYRTGDVPGSEIPALYHEFVRSGNLDLLLPVFKHNAMDLMTMAELLPKLIGPRNG